MRRLLLAGAAAATVMLAGVAAASSPWRVVAGFDEDIQLPLALAGHGIAIAPDGDGVIAWQANADAENTMVATFTATSPPRRLHVELSTGANEVAALGGGRAAIGVLSGGVNGTFSLQVVGPAATASAPVIPGAAQGLQSRPAVMASNGAGAIAVLGASGAQPVLTICSATACGRTVPLAPSTGILDATPGKGLAVAIGADRRAVAAWVEDGVLEARWRSPDGRLGPTQRLGPVHSQVWIAAAMSADDRAALVWESQDVHDLARPGPAMSATVAMASTAPAGGSFSTAARLASFPADRATAGPDDVTLAGGPVVAVAFDGARPLAAWTGHAAGGFVVRTGDLDALGSTGQAVSPPRTSATLGGLASSPDRGSIVVWLAPALEELQVAQAAAGQRFGAPQSLPGGAYSAGYGPSAAAAIDATTGTPWVVGLGGVAGVVVLSGPPAS